MHHYIQDSSILTLSYPGSRVDQLWSKLEDIAIITIILSPGCQQPFLIKTASDNRLSAAVFGPKWLVTTGCQQPLPKLNKGNKIHLGSLKAIFVKVSQNFIKSHLKFCLISQISAHSLWHVWASRYGMGASSIKTECIPTNHHKNTSYHTCFYSQCAF